MKKFRILFAALVAALSVWTVGHTSVHAAGAGAVTFTQTDHNLTTVQASSNPCTGAPGTLTTTVNDVFHGTMLANGTDWFTGTITGTFTFVPTDTTQPSYTGHFTDWFNQNANLQNGNLTFTTTIHGTGSDGSSLTFHEVGHITMSASGQITVAFDKATCG
jgi:hypothetical protein